MRCTVQRNNPESHHASRKRTLHPDLLVSDPGRVGFLRRGAVMQHLEQIVKFVNSHDCGIDNRARIVGDLVRIESVEVDSARNPTIVVNFVKSIREARIVLGY